MESFSLISDHAYVAQNASRIVRGLFEIALQRGWSSTAARLLTLSKSLYHRMWSFEHPLKQFHWLKDDVIGKLEARKATMERLGDMTSEEIGQYNTLLLLPVRHQRHRLDSNLRIFTSVIMY